MKILITGAEGQLGKAIIACKPNNFDLIISTKSDLDLRNRSLCLEKILFYKPDWIINCGAYTKVDKAEDDPELAFSINTDSIQCISEALRKINGRLLQISTDYVFDGTKNQPYKPNDAINPINVYGKSKAAAEKIIENVFDNDGGGLIIRTSWLMGSSGDNFALKILSLLEERDTLSIVCDQIGSPTTTFSLARICWKAIEKYNLDKKYSFPKILHWSDAGVASWYDVAVALKDIGLELGFLKHPGKIIPIKSEFYQSKAKRPEFSLLDSKETHDLLDVNYEHWRKQLYEIFKDLI